MKKKRNHIIVVISVCLISLSVFAQGPTKEEESITLDVNARSMTLPPFDTKFRVSSFSTDYNSITFEYYIDDIRRLEKQIDSFNTVINNIKNNLLPNIENIDPSKLTTILNDDNAVSNNVKLKNFIQNLKDESDNKKTLKEVLSGILKITRSRNVSSNNIDYESLLCVIKLYGLLDIDEDKYKDQIESIDDLRTNLIKRNAFKKRIKALKKGGNYYFIGDKFSLEVANGSAYFPKSIGPLHPEVGYTFKFNGKKKVDLKGQPLKSFKQENVNLIEKYFSATSIPGVDEIKSFKGEMIDLMKLYSNSDKIYNSKGDEITKDFENEPIPNSPLWNTIDKLDTENQSIDNLNKNVNNQIKKLIDAFSANTKNFKILDSLHLRLIKPTTALEENILNIPLNASVENNKEFTFSEFLGVLLNPDQNSFIDKLLKQNYRLKGSTLEEGESIDDESISLLISFFEKLLWKSFTKLEEKPKGKYSPTDILLVSNKTEMRNILNSLKTLKIKLNNRTKTHKKIELLKEKIPNLLENTFITESISINKTILINVFAEKNAYIGLDLGLLYAFNINGIFSFQGTHFYLTPINREAPFKYFDDYNRYFLKRISFYVGIAQIVSERNQRYDDIFAKNSLALGAGYRINRTLRLSLGGLVYNEINPNPLIEEKKLRIAPTVALSVDIDLTKALGALGTIIKF